MPPLNPFLAAFFRSSVPSQCTPVHHHILLVPTTELLLTHREIDSTIPPPEYVASEEFLASHVLRVPSGAGPSPARANGIASGAGVGAGSEAGPGRVAGGAGAGAGGGSGGGGGDAAPAPAQSLREVKGKARHYSTINGRSVIIKDAAIFTNKGFKLFTQATLLHDVLWYPDVSEPRQWLIYFISRPLVGTWEEITIEPAEIIEGAAAARRSRAAAAAADHGGNRTPSSSSAEPTPPRKRDIGSFHEVLSHFPMIARHMQPGLERLFREFAAVFEQGTALAAAPPSLPPLPSASVIPDPRPDGPVAAAAKRARSNSLNSTNNGGSRGSSLHVTDNFYPEDDEDVMRAALESAVTAAIDLFQAVDKQQLSLLGATTDLTGPLVERLIERYVAGNVHHILFPRVSAARRRHDLELDSKIRRMEHVDLSQLGISIRGGSRGKRELAILLGRAVAEFRRMAAAAGPHQMMDILLSTMKCVAQLATTATTVTTAAAATAATAATTATGTAIATAQSQPPFLRQEDRAGGQEGDQHRQANGEDEEEGGEGAEKPTLFTVNADTLVSLLLYVVIHAKIRHLQARIAYIRNFIFVEDVENGEAGYALSTFEAVLAYLALDSAGLRRASRRNKALWDAASLGDVEMLRGAMEGPRLAATDPANDDDDESASGCDDDESLMNGEAGGVPPSLGPPAERFSLGSGLAHVFPFQSSGRSDAEHEDEDEDESPPPSPAPPARGAKRVAMDTRSMSSGSEFSIRSRAASVGTVDTAGTIGTIGSVPEADVSPERLAQTRNGFGESVLMMAVQHGRQDGLAYLLSLVDYFPPDAVLDDANEEETTLLSAAVQMGDNSIVDLIISFVLGAAPPDRAAAYFASQDMWGRSVGHYLFHTPALIGRVGHLIPWRQRDKNGQTPLFALCRSYDHADYVGMVTAGLAAAAAAQLDRGPLHLDDHVDGRGNTLLHIVNDSRLAREMLQRCDADVNATNERRLTALMVASKYGRYDMVRTLYEDGRVDGSATELRGLTAVELAKDDGVRNRIDDLALLSSNGEGNATRPGLLVSSSDPDREETDGHGDWLRRRRTTGVVRAYFVEDATVRLVVKSAAPSRSSPLSSGPPNGGDDDGLGAYVVTTSRRSPSDFEHLASLLALESPASWIPDAPTAAGGQQYRTPFQIPSRPSRALLRDSQSRADWFVAILLAHPTFATHEALWEFLLVPDLRPAAMEERSLRKAAVRAERVRDELEPIEDVAEIEQFVDHARDAVRGVSYAAKSTARRISAVGVAAVDIHVAASLLHRALCTLRSSLPRPHMAAFDMYVRTLAPSNASPQVVLHATLAAAQLAMQAVLTALARPADLAAQMTTARRTADRTAADRATAAAAVTSPRSSWRRPLPLPLSLGMIGDDDARRRRVLEDREERALRARAEADALGRELAHARQVVAAELAGWQDVHERMCRGALREYARAMVVQERARLEGIRRALRRLRGGAGVGGIGDGGRAGGG